MHRFFVSYTTPDARATVKLKQFNSLGLKNKVGAVYLVDSFTVDTKLNKNQLEKAKSLLANSTIQAISTTHYSLPTTHFSYAIQISYLPGVTDNIGNTAKETLADGARINFKPGQSVYSSQVFFVHFNSNNRGQSPKASASGDILFSDAQKIASSLHNPLIQKATITSFAEFKKHGLPEVLPKVEITSQNTTLEVNLNVSDEELEKIGKLGILDSQIRRGPLALSLEELKAIRNHFNKLKRKPSDVELETLAQTWSEHCKHTIFGDPIDNIKDGLFKHYIRRATEEIRKQKSKNRGLPSKHPENIGDFCISVFSDNAGGIIFDKNYIISHKVETHNTPSALDPFGGAITGIVGVNRDSLGFGLGSKPVANFYGFCLAEPTDKSILFRDKELTSPMLSARRIMDGVIAGVHAGGNQSGIPTPLGFLYFDPRYRGKPLVFAGTMGLLPKKVNGKKSWVKKAKPGDLIVMIGGKVGADGIHGATFSSEGLDAHSPATAVQIGDPITQKKFSDAICKEARDLGLYNSITDCGAGGLSSSVGEMAKESGGLLVNLEKVPLKYPGLSPWQIWISESQERMVLAVPKNKWPNFKKLMHNRGVEATAIGQFTKSGKCQVKYNKKTVMDLEMEFLHNGRPKKHLKTKEPSVSSRADTLQNISESRDPLNIATLRDSSIPRMHSSVGMTNPNSHLLSLLSSPNITSTDFISTQYDHEVQGSSVIKPIQGKGRVNGEAAVFKPLFDSEKAVITSFGLAPHLSETNPYYMSQVSLDNAVRAAVATGANIDYLAILDNFCWCSSNEPERLWQLKETVRATYDTAVIYGTPFVSGKDSMFNDFKGFNKDGDSVKISIPPTLLITTMGVIPDATKALSIDAKFPGDLLYILNTAEEKFDAKRNLALYRSFYKAAQNNLISSSISVNQGGLGVALAKKLIAGGLGAEVKTNTNIFLETTGQILVSVNPDKAQLFESVFSKNIFNKIGVVTKNPILKIVTTKNKSLINSSIKNLETAYKKTFKDF